MAKSPTPITTELFRFATIRTPQLINEKKKKFGYLKHPNPQLSEILKQDKGDNIVKSRNYIREAAQSFNASKTVEEIKKINPHLYFFSQWLNRHLFTLAETGLLTESSGVNLLDEKSLSRVWDNLLYEVLIRRSPAIRQTCIMMLVANYVLQFVKNEDYKSIAKELIQTPRTTHSLTEQQQVDLFLQRIAKTKILLPKSVSRNKYTMTADGLKGGRLKLDDAGLKKKHRKNIQKDKQKRYQKISKDIRDSSAGLNKAGAAKISDLLEKQGTRFNDDTLAFLGKSGLQNMRIDTVEKAVNRKAGMHFSYKQKKSSTKTSITKFRYIVSLETFEDNGEVYITVNTGNDNVFVSKSDFDIRFGSSPKTSLVQAREVAYDSQGLVTMAFKPSESFSTTNEQVFSVNGSFELSDGSSFSINSMGSVSRGSVTGNGKQQSFSSPKTENSNQKIVSADSTTDEVILYGVTNLGMGVYRKVEQEVCCYVPGEVSHIENILAREYKERHTRSLISSESTEEESTETETEKQSDTSSTNRYELQSEIAKVLADERSFSAGASLGVSATYMGVDIDASGNIDYASSNSSSVSDSEAATYAEEVTSKALERILTKTSIKRTTRILQEYEENNRHGFDNREGTQHVTGVYRWIDIIYQNRLVNYGKRLMVEFVVPEPARFYRMVLEKASEMALAESSTETSSDDESDTDAPETLESKGISSFEDITEDNYAGLASYYGITVEEPMLFNLPTMTKTFGPNDDTSSPANPDAKELSYNFDFNFSEREDYSKYEVTNAVTEYTFDYHLEGLEDGTYFQLIIGTEKIKYDKNSLDDSNDEVFNLERKSKSGDKTLSLDGTKNNIDVSVNIKNVYDFAVTLKVDLALNEEEIENWQRTVYNSLLDAYNEMLAVYESEVEDAAASAAASQAENEQAVLSSDQCRQIEKRELKRLAIELFTKPFGDFEMGKDFYTEGSGSCENNDFKPEQINQSTDWLTYSSHAKFFEQAFDWDLISYIFYPYYYADQCKWAELCATTTGGDDTFLSFLQSGMARLVVPARKGFAHAIIYYMETGDIWNGGGLVVDADDDLYVSLEEELTEVEGIVEKEWQTRVPTTLTIVQGSSVYLEDEGLPCCEEVEDGLTETLLRGSTTILGSTESSD